MDHPDLPDPPEISRPVELPLADFGGAAGREGSDGESDSDSGIEIEGSAPGFGVATALSALGGYAWWRHRNTDDSESEAGDE